MRRIYRLTVLLFALLERLAASCDSLIFNKEIWSIRRAAILFYLPLLVCSASRATVIYTFTDTIGYGSSNAPDNAYIQFTLPSFVTSGHITSFDIARTSRLSGAGPGGEIGAILDFAFDLSIPGDCHTSHAGIFSPDQACALIQFGYPSGILEGDPFLLSPTSSRFVFADANGSTGAVFTFTPEPNTIVLVAIALALFGMIFLRKWIKYPIWYCRGRAGLQRLYGHSHYDAEDTGLEGSQRENR